MELFLSDLIIYNGDYKLQPIQGFNFSMEIAFQGIDGFYFCKWIFIKKLIDLFFEIINSLSVNGMFLHENKV